MMPWWRSEALPPHVAGESIQAFVRRRDALRWRHDALALAKLALGLTFLVLAVRDAIRLAFTP